ncbi:hypothetical protein GGTG_07372 [Gaeumannomyces tritici R3-111a-1]|uniref:Uncharacterized protein n=1 Tax=Gaeumannomyces tritici (strain R3-111a-1) TaxID=644352 RepID=J3P1H5_GAET3|nr:hypothetical protein GGTG_07372 [Gaeumannomyces tritici R3-111a-1]EJT77460.1 hypothetical protein GGTG_07372 [Gaeumannomyces tritici R3-111a-1]
MLVVATSSAPTEARFRPVLANKIFDGRIEDWVTAGEGVREVATYKLGSLRQRGGRGPSLGRLDLAGVYLTHDAPSEGVREREDENKDKNSPAPRPAAACAASEHGCHGGHAQCLHDTADGNKHARTETVKRRMPRTPEAMKEAVEAERLASAKRVGAYVFALANWETIQARRQAASRSTYIEYTIDASKLHHGGDDPAENGDSITPAGPRHRHLIPRRHRRAGAASSSSGRQ